MYKRLVTFGCSFTYGHGLADCHVAPNHAGPNPSKFAWPQLLATRRQLNCVNLSRPGGSNKLMWWRAVNFKFKPTDVVIFYTTFPDRDCILNNSDSIDDLHETYQLGLWPSKDKRTRSYRDLVVHSNSTKNWEYQSYVYLDYAYQHIFKQGVKNIFFFKHQHQIWQHQLPDWATFKFETPEISGMIKKWDYALDRSHPGPKSHKQIAKRLDAYLNV